MQYEAVICFIQYNPLFNLLSGALEHVLEH